LVRYRRTRDLPFKCNLGVDASPAHPASPASLAQKMQRTHDANIQL
jgi:hypothetical protein